MAETLPETQAEIEKLKAELADARRQDAGSTETKELRADIVRLEALVTKLLERDTAETQAASDYDEDMED